MKPATIREQWGARHFRCSPTKAVESLPLRQTDRELLRDIGLPVGPKTPLKLFMRFEDVEVVHRPRGACLLEDAGIEKAKKYPKTGHKELDWWVDLSQFVVIGEVLGTFFKSRWLCVDSIRGGVWWVYPKLSEGKTDCESINSGLASYLESLLAYKEFREEWNRLLRKYPNPDEADLEKEDRRAMRNAHRKFLNRLKKADPTDWEESFWFHHAWDEAILLES